MFGCKTAPQRILWSDRERQFKLILPKAQAKLRAERDHGCCPDMPFNLHHSVPSGCVPAQRLTLAVRSSWRRPCRSNVLAPAVCQWPFSIPEAESAHQIMGYQMLAFVAGLNKFNKFEGVAANSAGSGNRSDHGIGRPDWPWSRRLRPAPL